MLIYLNSFHFFFLKDLNTSFHDHYVTKFADDTYLLAAAKSDSNYCNLKKTTTDSVNKMMTYDELIVFFTRKWMKSPLVSYQKYGTKAVMKFLGTYMEFHLSWSDQVG